MTKTLAINPRGMSNRDYVLDASDWSKPNQFDEVWTLNRAGTIFKADVVFRMDDYHLMEEKGEGEQYINAALVHLANNSETVVYTSTAYPDYVSGLWEEFPLHDFLSFFSNYRNTYVNSSVPYMIGLAVMQGYKKIVIYGMDYNYNIQDLTGKGVAPTFAEDGRACTEYWIGVAEAFGVEVVLPKTSTLMGACRPETLYGYHDGGAGELAQWRDGNVD
jgi:hypothetical protein